MSNMSYCRFSNTLADLRDCYEHMDDDNNNPDAISAEEKKARDKLVKLCGEIAGNFIPSAA